MPTLTAPSVSVAMTAAPTALPSTATRTAQHDDAGLDVFEELDVDLWEEPERWDGLA